MAYTAEISRLNPSALLFLVDHSASMLEPFGSTPGHAGIPEQKAHFLAESLNRLIQDVVLRCAKEEGVRDYFHIGVIGYGEKVRFLLDPPGGASKSPGMVPVSAIAESPLRMEQRVRRIADGAGGFVDRTYRVPIWIEPHAKNGTPMCHAMTLALETVREWIDIHPDAFPPVVMNITDGEATDGDPTPVAARLRAEGTSDGEVLLFNIHLSGLERQSISFPDSASSMPDAYARLLYGMSSVLPASLHNAARQEGFMRGPDARGFVFNADPTALVRFMEIGTRPSNLR